MIELKDIKRIGLITGNGKFPLFICQAARGYNIEVVVIAITGETDSELSKYAQSTHWIELGEGKKLIDILKKENLKYVIMAGKIKKTTIFKQTFKMDEEARGLLKNVIDRRDDSILMSVANRLKKEGIQLLDSTAFLENFLAKRGIYTEKRPAHSQREDIDFGFKIAKAIGGLDIGQTVLVKDKAVIAVEAIEGTDEAILRAGKLTEGCIVIKVSKPHQDMRFDVPVIGLATIKVMKEAKADVLAIEADKTLIFDKEQMIREANEAGICIVSL